MKEKLRQKETVLTTEEFDIGLMPSLTPFRKPYENIFQVQGMPMVGELETGHIFGIMENMF